MYVLSGYEGKILQFTQLFLKDSKEGDEKSIAKKIRKFHPFYMKNPNKLLKMSNEKLAKSLKLTTKQVVAIRKFLIKYMKK